MPTTLRTWRTGRIPTSLAPPADNGRTGAQSTEFGRITLLAIGMLVAVLLLGYGVIAASHVHLERKELQSLAESLAVRAASAVSQPSYLNRASGGSIVPEQAARAGIAEYLSRLGPNTPEDFKIIEIVVDTHEVKISTTAVTAPPFLSDRLWPVPIRAHAQAQLYPGRTP